MWAIWDILGCLGTLCQDAEAQSRPWCTAALYRANGVAFGSCFRRSGRSSGAQGAAVDTVKRTREDKRGHERTREECIEIDDN